MLAHHVTLKLGGSTTHCAKALISPFTTVPVTTQLPPVGVVYHPEKLYPVIVGLVGKVHTIPPYVTTFEAGICPLPPFPSKFILYPRGVVQLAFPPPSVPKQFQVYVPVVVTILLGTPVVQRLTLGLVVSAGV